MPMTDTEQARAKLAEMLEELQAREAHLARDMDAPPSADSEDRASEESDDEALEAQGRLVAAEIASVKRALVRIEDGTYGECVRCGGEIASARLEARPEAALCIDCASREG